MVVALALEHHAVGTVAQRVEGRSAEQSIGKSLAPLVEVEVADHHGGGALVALGDQIVEILVLRGTEA